MGFLAAIVFLAAIIVFPLLYLVMHRHARRTLEEIGRPVPIVSPFDGTIEPMPKSATTTQDLGVRGY